MLRVLSIVWFAAACGKVVPSTPDAPPGDDAGNDGGGIDAPLLPTAPPVTVGQFADLAIGAPDLSTRTTGMTADTSRSAGGLCASATHLWITDLHNARVLQLNAPPLVFSVAADVAVGQTGLTTNTSGPSDRLLTAASGFTNLGDVACAGTRVVVSDSPSNRVLIWNTIPTTSGVRWDVVLGQTTATGAVSGTAATRLSDPRGVWTDGTRIVVADTGNNRVLIWTSMPTANDAPADIVLGQASFTTADAPTPPTPSSMNQPLDVFFDGERLYVSDSQNHRVMGWNGMPTANNQPADFFVGQNGGATGSPNAGAGSQMSNAIGLHLPGELTVAHGSLYVVDMVNFRVVVHTPRPTVSGEMADSVLGATDFTGGAIADDQTLTPRGVVVQGDKLFIADSNLGIGGSRVLRYTLANLP